MGTLVERRVCVTPDIAESVQLISVKTEERAGDSDEMPRIVGYTAVFGTDTEIPTFFGSFKERIQKGAFRRAIREGQDVRALRNHDPDNLLGRTASKTLRLKEDDTGLHIEVDSPNTSVGRDTVEQIRRGDLSGMSFAFIVRKEKWVNGDDGQPALRIIQDVDLYDVGPVTYPAYPQTSADIRCSSRAHQVGFAELGQPVPEMPAESIPMKVIQTVPTESDNRDEQIEAENVVAPSPEVCVQATPAFDHIASYRRRFAYADTEHQLVQIRLLTK